MTMAKIGNLQIDTIKIKGEAVHSFFIPDPATKYLVAVSNPLLLPIAVYAKPSDVAISSFVTRNSDGARIGICFGNYNVCYAAYDWNPIDANETYFSPGGGWISGAVLIKR